MNIFDPALRFEGERFLLRPLCESDLEKVKRELKARLR